MERQIDPVLIVIFGASGDLTWRKLVPALYDLYAQQLLPQEFSILGTGRTELSDTDFREKMKEGVHKFGNKQVGEELLSDFLKSLHYRSVTPGNDADFEKLSKEIDTICCNNCDNTRNILYYLSTPPSLYELIVRQLSTQNLLKEKKGFRRVIVEKPFGVSLDTAVSLNRKLIRYLKEEQVYRIDHYLGKETVQNLLVTRFANSIFEPLWNRNYVDRIEITASETVGVGSRGGYYDTSGALRDMLQNHLLQLLGLVAMEPPTVIDAFSIRNETLKVFQALRPIKEADVANQVVRGQYLAGSQKGVKQVAYRDEKGIPEGSRTETFVAMKTYIDNWRWSGVPFYLRTGKALPTRVSEVVISFKEPPYALFRDKSMVKEAANQLIIRIQPDEGILLNFGMKTPGSGYEVQKVGMDFHYSDLNEVYLPSAYERLLLDAILGDATLYSRGDAVEQAWKFVQPIIDAWEKSPEMPLYGYPAGTWGPPEAAELFDKPNQDWRYPCKNLSGSDQYCEL